MSWRPKLGPIAGVLAALVLVFASQAQARDVAKFKVLSISGTTNGARDVVYEPSNYGSCSFSQRERISFHSTEPTTAYAFTSKAHGSRRVEWWSEPDFVGNLTYVEVPGEVTISRSATYHQTNYVDPDTGETTPGCYNERSPVDCTVQRTLRATLNIGGTSDSDESTYVQLSLPPRDWSEVDEACPVEIFSSGSDDPRLFARDDLFKRRPKRLGDTDRVEAPVFDNSSDNTSSTGSIVQELAGELKRKKLKP